MKRVFVDANTFLRFFTRDVPEQQARAARLFESARTGETLLVTGPPVLFEVAWTLRHAYGLSRDKVLDVLESILGLPGLELTDRALVQRAVHLARESGQKFADSYIAVSSQAAGTEAVATFNRRDFRKLGVPLHDF